jgi:OOP family OmpA-OmpF porin
MKHRKTAIGVVSLAITLFNAPSLAQTGGPYIGASAGQAWIDVNAGEIESAFAQDDGFVASGTTIDDTDTAWKAFVGYRFNSFLALEGGYVDLGGATFVTTITSAPPPADALTPFLIHGNAEATGYNLTAIVGMPLGSAVFLFAKGGAFQWSADFSETIPGAAGARVARNETDTTPTYGVGIEFRMNRWLRARAEWERFEEVGSGIGGREGRNVDLASGGLVFGF